jgi:hypothetical protein
VSAGAGDSLPALLLPQLLLPQLPLPRSKPARAAA